MFFCANSDVPEANNLLLSFENLNVISPGLKLPNELAYFDYVLFALTIFENSDGAPSPSFLSLSSLSASLVYAGYLNEKVNPYPPKGFEAGS